MFVFMLGFSGGSNGKESTCNAEHSSSIPGSERSHGERNGHPLQYSCLENSMERSLTDYSSWGCNELDMIERLTLSLSLYFVILQLNIVVTTSGLPFPCFIMSLREILHLGMPGRKSF